MISHRIHLRQQEMAVVMPDLSAGLPLVPQIIDFNGASNEIHALNPPIMHYVFGGNHINSVGRNLEYGTVLGHRPIE